ncbi:MAG TPA: HPr family phosphocarrier protein [Ktedonobacterales bacterium]|nr:HPr family phosphocarrier protein [Ktedonobacterales bacterium]
MAVVETTLTLTNRVGLHARPASLWVQTAARFRAQITTTCKGRTANARRILEVLQLGAGAGAVLTVRAEGDDAEEAVAALAALVESRFGEDG